MFDRIFAPALTFVTLLAATVGMVLAMLYEPRPAVEIAQAVTSEPIVLETVVITGKRLTPASSGASQARPVSISERAAEGRGVRLHRDAQ